MVSNVLVVFRESLPRSESAKSPPSPRLSCPRSVRSESQLPRSLLCWARRGLHLLEQIPRRKDICQRTWDRRSLELSAEVWPHSRGRKWPTVNLRGYKVSNLESTLLLLECDCVAQRSSQFATDPQARLCRALASQFSSNLDGRFSGSLPCTISCKLAPKLIFDIIFIHSAKAIN